MHQKKLYDHPQKQYHQTLSFHPHNATYPLIHVTDQQQNLCSLNHIQQPGHTHNELFTKTSFRSNTYLITHYYVHLPSLFLQ